MQGTPSSHIENLGLHGPQVAQRLADRGAVSRQPDGVSQVGDVRLSGAMTPEELDQAIKRACTASEAWFSQWKHLNDQTCLDMAYHFMGIARQLQRMKAD